MKSIKKKLCCCIIHIVVIELGKNSQFFVEITIRTRPSIYIFKFIIYVLEWIKEVQWLQLIAQTVG